MDFKKYEEIVKFMRLNGLKRFKTSDVEMELGEYSPLVLPALGNEAVSATTDTFDDQDIEPELPILEDPITYGSDSASVVPRIAVQPNWRK